MKTKKRKGGFCIFIGLLMIVSAIGLALYNIRSDLKAGELSQGIIQKLEIKPIVQDISLPGEDIPNYMITPDIEMPVKKVDGNYYSGILQIPGLGLELPILNEFSYDGLMTSPCRYSGSVYKDNFVIAAHNFMSHFGKLSDISMGDKVIFIDADGNVFNYVVVDTVILNPYDVEEMTSGNWPLTLFTCNYSGQARITVLCDHTGN